MTIFDESLNTAEMNYISCLILALTLFSSAPDPKIETPCSCKHKLLFGNVKVVTAGADLRVQVVDIAPDLRVDTCVITPRRCGEWHMVSAGADFTIQLVTISPDIRIQYVTLSPSIIPVH